MLKAKQEFEKRYYWWSLSYWENEIRQDFPILRSVKDVIASRAVRIMESLNEKERWIMAKALVKRARQPNILTICGDPLTEEDKRFADLFMDLFQMENWREASMTTPEEAKESIKTLKKLKRNKLKQSIIKELSPILGGDYHNWSDWKEFRYHNVIGPWTILTHFDISGTHYQLSYHHYIVVSEHVYLGEYLSILRWLGVASETDWEGLCDSDIEPTSKSLAVIIKHFMDAAPKLLSGLKPE